MNIILILCILLFVSVCINVYQANLISYYWSKWKESEKYNKFYRTMTDERED